MSVDSVELIRKCFSRVSLITGSTVPVSVVADLRNRIAGSATAENEITTLVDTETVGKSEKIVSARAESRPQPTNKLYQFLNDCAAAVNELCEMTGLSKVTVDGVVAGKILSFAKCERPVDEANRLYYQVTGHYGPVS